MTRSEIMAINYILIQDMDENNEDIKTILNWATSPNRICTINNLVDSMFCSSKTIKFLKHTELPYYLEEAINRIIADKMLPKMKDMLIRLFGKENSLLYNDYLYNVLIYINTDESKYNQIYDLVTEAIAIRNQAVEHLFAILFNNWKSEPNNPYRDFEYCSKNRNGFNAAIQNLRNMAAQQIGEPLIKSGCIPNNITQNIDYLIRHR